MNILDALLAAGSKVLDTTGGLTNPDSGSVFDKPRPLQTGNALLDTILAMVDKGVRTIGDPLQAIGAPVTGVEQAMLGPIGKALAGANMTAGDAAKVNRVQKQIVKAIFRGDPQTLQDIVASPEMLHVTAPGAASSGMSQSQNTSLVNELMGNAFASFRPTSMGGSMRIDPAVLRGQIPERMGGGLLSQAGVEGLPSIATHEGTHFLNEPFFRENAKGLTSTSNEINQGRLARALEPFIEHAAYGPDVVRNFQRRLDYPASLNEALSYLSQPEGRTTAATWLNQAIQGRTRAGGIGQFDQPTQNLLMDALGAAKRVFPKLVEY